MSLPSSVGGGEQLGNVVVALVVGSLDAVGGAERRAIELARYLNDHQGARAHVVGLSERGQGAALCERAGVDCTVLTDAPIRGRTDTLAVAGLLRAHLIRRRVEVVLPVTYLPNVLCGLVWRFSGVRSCIWHQVDTGLWEFPRPFGRLLQRLALWLTRSYVANSDGGEHYLVHALHVSPRRISVVPNGVALGRPRDDRPTWRRRLGTEDGSLVVTMLANLSGHKDHDTLLRAWRVAVGRLAERGQPAVLVLAGREGDTAAALRALIEELGVASSVRCLGNVDDIGGLLSATDLGVFSSRAEGCPNGVIECMAAGLAIAATDAPGIRDVLGPDARAHLSAPGDAAALAQNLETLGLDAEARRRIGEAHRRRAAEQFDSAVHLARMAGVIAGSLGSSGRRRRVLDLSDLTVFVLTCGEPSTAQCLEALRAQDCRFTLEVIDRVAPMNIALQQMIDRCRTSYYVQVDADMILVPTAIRTLYTALQAEPPPVAVYVGHLWGDAEEIPIQGISDRHAVLRRFPYQASASCEMTQARALEQAGHPVVVAPVPGSRERCLGLHFSLQTPRMAFQRWKRLMLKYRRYDWMVWLKPYPVRLRERARAHPTPINEAAHWGAIVGLAADLGPDAEKDFRDIDEDYERLAALFVPAGGGQQRTWKFLRLRFLRKVAKRLLGPQLVLRLRRNRADPQR